MMSLGIDIHPVYQEYINWKSLSPSVEYIWLKVSDGGSAYKKTVDGRLYTPDSHASGMKTTKAACGGYHYAQPSPSPEVQADILDREVRRLGLTTLAPALDLEAPFTPNAVAKDFAYRFLKRLKSKGWPQVVIYSYTTMAQFLRPDLWDISGLITWIARPGPIGNLGVYRGRTDVHQYDSAGRIAGIAGSVDCNKTLNNNLFYGEGESALTCAFGNGDRQLMQAANARITTLMKMLDSTEGQGDPGGAIPNVFLSRFVALEAELQNLKNLVNSLDESLGVALTEYLTANPPVVEVDNEAVAEAVWSQARDNDPTTGPVT